ncbi:hypothetical protein [Nocardioides sp. URHA0020]|uniref:hypothetical protein n=1 Tax=Nocardioides sp. URHA0020 TaxID=1380392 RepID=UPI0012DF0005|nr:hypothetical protein [Nocardioides sp. URHA0020]
MTEETVVEVRRPSGGVTVVEVRRPSGGVTVVEVRRPPGLSLETTPGPAVDVVVVSRLGASAPRTSTTDGPDPVVEVRRPPGSVTVVEVRRPPGLSLETTTRASHRG